jgi:hypothetical protein
VVVRLFGVASSQAVASRTNRALAPSSVTRCNAVCFAVGSSSPFAAGLQERLPGLVGACDACQSRLSAAGELLHAAPRRGQRAQRSLQLALQESEHGQSVVAAKAPRCVLPNGPTLTSCIYSTPFSRRPFDQNSSYSALLGTQRPRFLVPSSASDGLRSWPMLEAAVARQRVLS